MVIEARTAAWAVLLGTGLSVAEGAPPKPVTELEDVTVVGRATDLTGIAGAASEGRVGQLEINARPILRAGEILEVIPGFIATQHSGTGKANQYFLRGFNLDHGTDFSAKVDGIPINLPTHGHGQGYLDLNHIVPELVEVVDFKKGPYYAEVGDFSSAGSAHIHLFDELPQGLAKIGIGEDAFYRGVIADSFKLEQGVVLGAFEVQAYDGPWENPENGLKLNGLLKYTMGDESRGLRLSGMGYSGEWDSTDQIAFRAVRDGRVGRLGALNPTNGGDTDRYSLSLEAWKDHGAAGRTRGLAYVSYYDFNLWSDFTYFLDDPVNGDQFRQFDERVYLGGELEHQVWTEWKERQMQHRFGLQLRHDIIDQVGLEKTVDRRFLSTVRSDAVDETALGLYYENTAYWHPRFRSVVGIRGDAYVFDVSDSTIPENSGYRDDAIASPKISLVYSPAANTEIYASGGFGFHSNDGRGTTTVIDPNSGEPVDPVDPLVVSKGAEIGLRTTARPGLQSTLALWYLQLDSELVFVGDAGTTEPSGASERYGVEWANFYQVNSWLTLDFDLAYVEAEFSDEPSEANQIPGAIPLVIAAGAAIDLDNGVFGSVRLRHFGEYPLIEDDTVKADSTSLVNLQIGYRLKERPVSFHLDVLNVFDAEDSDIEYFYASRLPGEPAEGIEDVHFHPVEPRTFRGYVAMRF
jgi:hypothetical protein